MMIILFIFGGFFFLFVGGEVLVCGFVGVVCKVGMLEFVIGLILVGFGISLLELVISFEVLYEGVVGILIGNVIGLNVVNIMLVIGVVVFVCVIIIDLKVLVCDGVFMIVVIVLFVVVVWIDGFICIIGIMFIVMLIVYLVILVVFDCCVNSLVWELYE